MNRAKSKKNQTHRSRTNRHQKPTGCLREQVPPLRELLQRRPKPFYQSKKSDIPLPTRNSKRVSSYKSISHEVVPVNVGHSWTLFSSRSYREEEEGTGEKPFISTYEMSAPPLCRTGRTESCGRTGFWLRHRRCGSCTKGSRYPRRA